MNMKVFLVLNRIQLTVSLYHYPIFKDRFTNLKNEENSHIVKIWWLRKDTKLKRFNTAIRDFARCAIQEREKDPLYSFRWGKDEEEWSFGLDNQPKFGIEVVRSDFPWYLTTYRRYAVGGGEGIRGGSMRYCRKVREIWQENTIKRMM